MRKLLFVSGSVGLGHVQRDVRIARELMSLRDDLQIVWLAADPATRVLKEEGMTLLPECDERDVGTSMIESVAGDSHRVNMTEILYRVRKEDRYAKAVKTFFDIVKREGPDLVIADEAYELEGAHARDPEGWPPTVFLWDFVKVYPGRGWSVRDRRTSRMVNKGWDRAFREGRVEGWTDIFLGDLEDIPDEMLGWGMVNARNRARGRFEIVGNPLQFDPSQYADKEDMRGRLGYGPEHLLICSSGGTAIGIELLRLCLKAFPKMRQKVPDLRMVLVKGPRMEGDLGQIPYGVIVKGYVPRLFEHFAAADMAIIQGGGGSTLELAALGRPFLYFPLEGHSEQQVNVAGKLERSGVGTRCSFKDMTPERLADLVSLNIDKKVKAAGLSVDGCSNAAKIIERLVP